MILISYVHILLELLLDSVLGQDGSIDERGFIATARHVLIQKEKNHLYAPPL